ncbi:hypothetical protein [Segniliparus rugosus]|uniref:Uncharacterized protein n=1 Tax=Segniliparus rugosus (strain ATCC BAA-974 / DSM 45345 / CCUG 50838 / CIP 108380 / JCM 13579 / CDC 945) TaxID=679197 RepID=E5XV72_SEGRC|nr:hypothetical protein [Segniliparus rugosus]EFV11777.1 hypothetical protein HMPREF9336_03394 [Segniliparus rugosus ATCC BAA-974]
MRTLSALLAVSAVGLAANLFPASAHAIGNAPAICDVADSHASAVLNASNAFTDVLGRSDPTDESSQAQFRATRADLIHKLRDEADAIDGQDTPAEFQAVARRYTAAERTFADAIVQGDIDSFQTDVDERNSAQHALFAQCNAAIGDQPSGDKTDPQSSPEDGASSPSDE